VFDSKGCVEATDVETTCLFPNASFELCERQRVNDSHLTLDPVVENVNRKGAGIQKYQFIRVDCFTNCCQTLYEAVESALVFDEGAIGAHFEMIEMTK
jgi:hypothetical protein